MSYDYIKRMLIRLTHANTRASVSSLGNGAR